MTESGVDLEHGIPQDEATVEITCEGCGAVVEEGQTRCPQCGMAIDEEDEVEKSLIHWGDETVFPEDLCNT